DLMCRMCQIRSAQPGLFQPATRASVHASKARTRNQQRGKNREVRIQRPQLGEVVDLAGTAHISRGWQKRVLHDGAQERGRGEAQRLAREQVEQLGVSYGLS